MRGETPGWEKQMKTLEAFSLLKLWRFPCMLNASWQPTLFQPRQGSGAQGLWHWGWGGGGGRGWKIKRESQRGVTLNRWRWVGGPGRRAWEPRPTDSGDQELQMAFCLDAIKNVIWQALGWDSGNKSLQGGEAGAGVGRVKRIRVWERQKEATVSSSNYGLCKWHLIPGVRGRDKASCFLALARGEEGKCTGLLASGERWSLCQLTTMWALCIHPLPPKSLGGDIKIQGVLVQFNCS